MTTELEDAKTTLASQNITLDEWFDQRFAQKIEEYRANKTPRLSILVSKGTLDWAYPPFIIASTAGAMGWNVSIFFTFYGLGLLGRR